LAPPKENSNTLLGLTLTLAYLIVNAVFVLKYGSRIVTHGYLLVAVYLVAVPTVFWLLTKLPSRIFTNRTYIAIAIAFSVFMGIVFFLIPQESLRVDRYETIRLFWDNTFAGINPYTPRKVGSNIPSGFPCYFVLALPFYILREGGLLSLTGFLFFSYMLYRSSAGIKAKIIVLLLLTGSPAFAWEITCRSTIFLNMVLLLGLILEMEKQSIVGFSSRESIGYGLLTGFIACTRSVTILVLVPYFLYLWRKNRAPHPVLYATTAIAAFGIPFLPLLSYSSFFQDYNPFSVQISLMPGPATAVVGLISCAVALCLKDLKGFVFFQSLCLFVIALIFVSLRIYLYGWHNSLIGDKADISYFILAFPFLFISIALLMFRSKVEVASDGAG
jgi:hypothetical protein